MSLVLDSGPLVAAFDRRDRHHLACRRLIEFADEPLVVPMPVLAEVDYLLGSRVGSRATILLIDEIIAGVYRLEGLAQQDIRRISELMSAYIDSDIGFVDASVFAVVERLNEPKVATLDQRHFAMMRPRHVAALRLLPE